jgi:hypothetical protein
MAEPPRKSRRISSKRSRALHIEDNQEIHIPAQSNACSTAQSEGSDITEKIQAGIQASSLAKGYDSGPPSLHPWRI